APGAAWRIDLKRISNRLADQRAGDGRRDRDAAGLHVGLLIANNLVGLFFLGILVNENHRRPELDRVTGQLLHVDDFGAGDIILKLADAAFIEALGLLGGMIFGIFRQIAVGTCLGNSIDDARTLFLLAPAKLFLQLLIPGQSHRNLVHICITFSD